MPTVVRRAAYLLTSVLFATLLVQGAQAVAASSTFAVTTTMDEVDASPGDGVCAGASGACTLRAAVMEANSTPDGDIISLEAPAPAVYELTLAGAGEDNSTIGDLDLTRDVTIVGRGPAQDTVDAGGLDRVIHVLGNGNSAVLEGFTITGGLNASADGGGILNAGTLRIEDTVIKNNFSRGGGGVSSSGSLTVDRSLIEANTSSGQAGGINVTTPGAATVSNTLLSLNDSEIRSNFAESVGGGLVVSLAPPFRYEILRSSLIGNSATAGGGIWNNTTESNTPSLIRDTTLALNSASDTSCSGRIKVCSATAEGGAVVNIGTLVLQNDTIVLNSANKGGGGIANGTASVAGQTTASNTIIAKNHNGVADNCINGALISLGGNVEDTPNDCGIDSDPGNPDADGDLINTDPQLGPEQSDPFGRTSYYPPLETSPVIDAGDDTLCTPDDQLGQPRPADGNGDSVAACDIGAFEVYEKPAECDTFGAVCGTGGDDEIQGTDGNDILVGGPGDDHIVCEGGNDTVYADEGNDVVECGEGDDVVFGGPGDDLLVGGAGADFIKAGDGDDSLYGDFEEPTGPINSAAWLNDRGEGIDALYGEGGNDFGFGGGAFDRLFGGIGKDRMWGGVGDDKVKGQAGSDKLYGQNGNDTLDGGEGPDELRAGDGRDLCIVGGKDTVSLSCEGKKRSHKRSH